MPRIITIAVLLLLAAFPTSSQSKVEQSSKDEQMLVQLENKIAAALVRRDTKFLDDVYADGFTRTDPYSGEMNKGQALARLKSNVDNIESININSTVVRFYGDTAVVTGQMMVKGRNPEGEFAQQYQHLDRFTHTFVKRQGQWQLVAAHASIIVAYGIRTDY